jgi:hypothetical protein
MQQITEEAALYSLEDAAKVLGRISSWTLRKHLKRGNVAAVRIGRRLFLGRDEVHRIQAQGLPSLRSDTVDAVREPRR